MTAEGDPPRLLGGRYRVDALLGRGGMSEVHHGYDERLDRPVAIKMLRQPTRRLRHRRRSASRRLQPDLAGHAVAAATLERLLDRAEVAALLESDDNTAAVRLLEAGLARSSANRFFGLELRRLLGLALFYVGEHRRAAALLADVGKEYRAGGLPASHPRVLECAYHAGHAFAEIGEPQGALAQLRFFVQNADAQDPENSELVLESSFVIAQMLATDERTTEALTELEAIRPTFQTKYGPDSVHVRNLERQIDRLRSM